MISRYVARWSPPASYLSQKTEAELASAYAALKRVVIDVADRTEYGVDLLSWIVRSAPPRSDPWLVLLMFWQPMTPVKSMQNAKPPPPSLASPIPVLDRVIAIAPAPLLPGEKETDYTTIAVRIVRASGPRDAIEELLIRDIIDLTWEILRIRRVKAGILKASVGDGVSKVLASVGHPYLERDTLSHGWAAGDERARTKVDAILTKAGMTIDEVMAKTLESKLDSYERLDRMLASLEARRNNALREIDRHRAALGSVVRQSIEEIEDADFRDVETGQATTGP